MFNNDDMRYGKLVNHSAPKHLVLGHPKKMFQPFVGRRMWPFSVAGVSSTLAACVNSFTAR